MTIFVDFETRSAVPIKLGAWKYAEHESTQVLCMALKEEGRAPMIWLPEPFDAAMQGHDALITTSRLKQFVEAHSDDQWEAHNAEFERAIWARILCAQHGVPEVTKWDCSAARAARLALPRALGAVCDVVGAETQKDAEGHRLMMKMCKPRKPRAAEKKANPRWADTLWWHEEPEDIRRLAEYCMNDVRAEESLSALLPPLPEAERKIFELDHVINKRGLRIDLLSVQQLLDLREDYRSEGIDRIRELTGDPSMTENTAGRLLEWVQGKGVSIPNLQAGEVAIALEDQPNMDPEAREVLELRASLAKTSIKKLVTMQKATCDDGRLRSQFLYHGASTGRWTGKGVQPHNLPRGGLVEEPHVAIDALGDLSPALVQALWGDPMDFCSAMTRPMIIPEEGHVFLVADFSAIEGRVLAWLADERSVVQKYEHGEDLYIAAASNIYRIAPSEVTHQRKVGKVSELALGYQGGIGAFVSMGANYGLRVRDYEALYEPMVRVADLDQVEAARDNAQLFFQKNKKSRMTDQAAVACDLIKQQWRRARPCTTAFWEDTNEAAVKAIMNPGKSFQAGSLRFIFKGSFLRMWLPSGRALHYFAPYMDEVETPWGEYKDAVHFHGTESTTKRWTRKHTYGGKLVENATQAVARDLLRDAMLRCDDRWPIHLHVHDEIVSEVPANRRDELDEFCKEMSRVPSWATGLPIGVAGFADTLYRKD